MRCPYEDGLLWRAQFRVVVSRPVLLSSGKTVETYEDVTQAFDEEIRMGEDRLSSCPPRARTESRATPTTSGLFHYGCIVGGESVVADALVNHYTLHGRRKGIIALTPETCVARRRMLVSLYPHFVEWQMAYRQTRTSTGWRRTWGS